jgi:glycosyltransferase involved in cell wall biosynthesis
MRVLTITNWYPPHHRGGYEVNCADVMNRLSAAGHHVEVLCSDERLPGAVDRPEPVPVRREIQMYWRDERPWTPPIRQQRAIEQHNQAALERALDAVQPDVVSAWHMAAFSLNLLTTIHRRDIPIVYSILDAWPSYTITMDPWAQRFHGRGRRTLGRLVERMVGLPVVLPDLGAIGTACFCSPFMRRDIAENGRWSFPDTDVIPCGVDRSILANPAAPTSADRDWAWRLAYFGRFDTRKGVDTLLRAVALLPPETTLSMYGRGGEDERVRLHTLAADLGIADRVSFGTLDASQLGDAYRAADCVVFPSEWPEPFGMVPLESMECATPVIGTGTGGSGDFLDNGDKCLIFAKGDPDSLADAVRTMAADPALRRRLRTAGFVTAEEYDVDRIAESYERRFTDSIAARRGGVA